jgi:hypothetical protein
MIRSILPAFPAKYSTYTPGTYLNRECPRSSLRVALGA